MQPSHGRRKTQTSAFPKVSLAAHLMRRAKDVFEHIHQQPFQHVLVIAHGGVLTAALKALINVPAERNPFSLYNGSISMVDWTSQFRLLTLNQLDHLRAEGLELRSRTGDL